MKEIVCYSQKYGNHTALIDDEDFESINKHRWNIHKYEIKQKLKDQKIQYKFYAQTCIKINRKRHLITMHQIIMGKVEKGFVIDHIDGNSLNNTRTNLRIVTIQKNNQNKKPKNTYLGVCFSKKTKKFQCSALAQSIGRFIDEKTAAIEYDKFIIRNLGPDSFLNFKYTQEEIQLIKNEIITPKNERELPANIFITPYNKYQVQFNGDIYKKFKNFETLDAAIAFKEECLQKIEKLKTEKLQLHYKSEILYNLDGISYIPVKYKNQEFQCLVDSDKWHDLSLISWRFNGKYVLGTINGKSERISRYLYQKYLSDVDITNKLIDHIHGIDELHKRLDNRMINLRAVTSGENNYNKKTNNKWGYRGVEKNYKKYRAFISYNNEIFKTKGFESLEEAAHAYNELALKYYGDKAILNVIKT